MDLRPYYNEEIEFVDHSTLQHEAEVRESLLHILRHTEIRNVIEIGTWEGGTAFIFAQIVDRHEGHVYCVDTAFGSKGGTPDFVCDASNRIDPVYQGTRFEKRVVEIQGRSEDPETITKLARMLNGLKVDLLFHDGDHHYFPVLSDLRDYAPFVRKGGWIAICDWGDLTHGVSRVWPEVKKHYEHHEFLIQDMPKEKQKSHRWLGFRNGIGLLRWEGTAHGF